MSLVMGQDRNLETKAIRSPRVSVIIPCYNEAFTIAEVIKSFHSVLPEAEIYVYDNNSEDDTAKAAQGAGAIVCREPNRGKGNVIRRMFADIDADIYVMVDGDGTYDAKAAPELIRLLIERQADMVVGARQFIGNTSRPGHRFGNAAFALLVRILFGRGVTDLFSGYRVLTKRFVKSCPILSSGFEIETELSIHALEVRIPFVEYPVAYYERPKQSPSKLKTFKDGARILATVLYLLKEKRPFSFFAAFALLFATMSCFVFYPVFMDYLKTGLVSRFPTAILSAALMLSALLSLACGLILNSVSRGRLELRRLHYLNQPQPTFTWIY